MSYICPGIGLIALLIALLWWWLRRNGCRHDLSLRNVAAATNAYAVRVSAFTPAAQIVDASAPPNWIRTTNYPAGVLWKPVGGGPIPSGNPLPGPFSIWVQNNAQPDKRVLIEWLSKGGQEVICRQLLRVGCGEKAESVPEDEPVYLPHLGDTYEVCLKTTDLVTDCMTITPTRIQNKPKFRKDYNSCTGDNILVQFYNESTSTSCASTWLWDFGDGATSTAESPSHVYTTPFNNPYTVKLTMFVPGGQTFSTTQQIKLYQWQPDLTINEICSDGHVIYHTTSPNPSWTFPDGSPPRSTESGLRVCYINSGPKTVKLYAINDDDGYCEVVRDLNILDQNFSRCCPHDSTRETFEFDYKGKSYRLLALLRCHGFPHPVVFARSKLQVYKNNKWKRKWGGQHELRIDLSGNLYTKKPSGCHCSIGHPVSGSKHRTLLARVSKHFMPPLISRTRMRQTT